jgi:hypothetical protein
VSNGENVLKPNLPADSVSNCKTLSKSEKLSNPETLKTIFKISQITWLCRSAKISQAARNEISKNLSNPENLSSWQTVSFKISIKNKTVSKSNYVPQIH